MKVIDFRFAILADQIASRAAPDRVPAALAALNGLPLELPFERTAGDEIEGLTQAPQDVVAAVQVLTRLTGWRIGIGLGAVETPLPNSARSARGPAFVAAREAIIAARRAPTELRLVSTSVTGAGYGANTVAKHAEAALWLYRSVLARRSEEGWELLTLLDEGLSRADAARRLGISESAVSQRLGRAGQETGVRGAELCTTLLEQAQQELTLR